MQRSLILIAALTQLTGCIITPSHQYADRSIEPGFIDFSAPPPPYTDPLTTEDRMCQA